MPKLKIMYVDDECAAITNFQHAVADCPMIAVLHTFQTAEEAIAYVQENPIDMAFLDVDLGQMNGFVLCEKLRAIRPDLAVAFVTGNIAYMSKAKRIVKAPYIFKPCNGEDIAEVLHACHLMTTAY